VGRPRTDLLCAEGPAGAACAPDPNALGPQAAADLVRKQLPDGSWKYPGKTVDPRTKEDYFLLETFRNLRVLVEQYGFTRAHPTLQKTTRYMFLRQTAEGDIRGILGNQYMPYYHAAILELLIKAGYAGDRRVKKGLDWLLAMRQDDGGWIIPCRPSRPRSASPGQLLARANHPARSREAPRAPGHRDGAARLRRPSRLPAATEVLLAARQLKERFFKADAYGDRKGPEYWLKFQFPFWWSNLLTPSILSPALGLRGKIQRSHSPSTGSCQTRTRTAFGRRATAQGSWPAPTDVGSVSPSAVC